METPEILLTRRSLEEKWKSKDGNTTLLARYETRGFHLSPPEKRVGVVIFTLLGEVRSRHEKHDSELRAEIDMDRAATLGTAIDAIHTAAFERQTSKQDAIEFSSELKCPPDLVLCFGFRFPAGRQPESEEAFLGIRGPNGESEIRFSYSSDLGEVSRFIRRASRE